MKKFLFMAFLLVTSLSFSAAAAENEASMVTLKAGTPVCLKTLNDLSSGYLTAGNAVDFMVVNDVRADGIVVIPAGSIAHGTVISASRKSIFGIEGQLQIGVDGCYASDGTFVPLSGGTISASGVNHTVLSVICTLCTLIGLIISGTDAYIPAGATVTPYVAVNVPVTIAAAQL